MRKSISVTFFSMVATLLVLGTAVLGCSEWLLFSRYFAQERYDTLDSVADVTQRAADYIVQQAALPKGAELDALNTKLEIIGESAEAYLFFTDEEGRILIASNPEMVGTDIVGPELMKKVMKIITYLLIDESKAALESELRSLEENHEYKYKSFIPGFMLIKVNVSFTLNSFLLLNTIFAYHLYKKRIAL